MKKRGEITVFLSLSIVCILSLLMGLLESARTVGAGLYLNMAVNSAMSSLMSRYNRNLWDTYRLLFLEYESEAAVLEAFDDYLDFYLEQENLYPMKKRESRIKRITTMTEEGGRPLEEEIGSYVKYRMPEIAADMAGLLENSRFAEQAGNFRELMQVCHESGKEVRELEKVRRRLEKSLKTIGTIKSDAESAAESRRKRKLKKKCRTLLEEIENFSDLTEQYSLLTERISKIREDMEKKEARPEETASFFNTELSAVRDMEQAAKEELKKYREKEDILAESRSCLESVMELLRGESEDEGEENGSKQDEEDGEMDWEYVQECLEDTVIPEAAVLSKEDKESAALLDRLENIFSGDLLELVVPDDTKISEKKISASQTVGDCEGELPKENVTDKILTGEYCLLFFDSFLGECESRGSIPDQPLEYELEYLLCGKNSDRENLSVLVERLIAVRGAMNLFYLLYSQPKREQVRSLAIALSAGNVPAELILSFFILSLWAFGEAVCDVRGILAGGRVPFFKEDSTWKLGLDGLLSLNFLEPEKKEKQKGMSYMDYLRILLLLENGTVRNARMMSVIQMNVRKKQGDFAVKDCAIQVELETEVIQRHVFFRRDSYEKTIEAGWSY